MQTEHVILLNAQGVPTGTLEKYAAHTADTLLHLAFSSWLFNAKGQLLVTRRALSKKAWPAVCAAYFSSVPVGTPCAFNKMTCSVCIISHM